MKHILLPLLTLCSLTLIAQQKKINNPTIVSQDKLKKVPTVKTPHIDSVRLKPGGTSTEILYNDAQIKAITDEAYDYFQKDFKPEQVIILVKDKYYLSLAQATRVLFNAYFNSFYKFRWDAPWPYDLQLIISNAYSSKNLASITLLKQGGEVQTFPFVFFYFYFLAYAENHAESDIAQKISDHFKLYIEAGYDPEEIFTRAFAPITPNDDRSVREIWKGYYAVGMKKANIPVQKLIAAMHLNTSLQRDKDFLLKAGYTPAEIDNATK